MNWQPYEQRWAAFDAKREQILREKWEKIHAAEAQIEAAKQAIRMAEWEAEVRERQLEREFEDSERRQAAIVLPTVQEAA